MRRVVPTQESGESETRQIMRSMAAPKRRPPANHIRVGHERGEHGDCEDRPYGCTGLGCDAGRNHDEGERGKRQAALVEEHAREHDLQTVKLKDPYEVFHRSMVPGKRIGCASATHGVEE